MQKRYFEPVNKAKTGIKKSVSYFFFGIGVIATMYAIQLTISADLEWDWRFIFLIPVMIFTGYDIFNSKPTISNKAIALTDDYIEVNSERFALSKIELRIFKNDDEFIFYHLHTKQGSWQISSIVDDDLLFSLEDLQDVKTIHYNDAALFQPDRKTYQIQTEGANFILAVDANSGKYSFNNYDKSEEPVFFKPKHFYVNPDFKESTKNLK